MTFGKFGIIAAAVLIASAPAWALISPSSGSVKSASSIVHWGENQDIDTTSGVAVGGTIALTCAKAAGCGILVQGVVQMFNETAATNNFTCVLVDGVQVPPLCVSTVGGGVSTMTALPVSGVMSVGKGKHKITVNAQGGAVTGYNISAQLLQ